MTISKARKDKRKANHYKVRATVFILIGGHPDWLPKNDQGNLFKLNQQIASIEGGDKYFTEPRIIYHGTNTGRFTSNTPSFWSSNLIERYQANLDAAAAQGLRVQDQQGQDTDCPAAPVLGCDPASP